MKLSGRPDMARFEGLGMGLLAMTCADVGVRIWDLVQSSNYMLELNAFNLPSDEVATCVAYNPIKSLLAVGTNNKHIAIWKYAFSNIESEGEYHFTHILRTSMRMR